MAKARECEPRLSCSDPESPPAARPRRLPPHTSVLTNPHSSYPADRNQRLKDARGEASKEIEQLRAKKDAQFREFEDQVRLWSPPPSPPCPEARGIGLGQAAAASAASTAVVAVQTVYTVQAFIGTPARAWC